MTNKESNADTTVVVPSGFYEKIDEELGQLARGAAVGRYMVVDQIGKGGMGVVYKAFDPDLNRPIALKLLTIPQATFENSQDFAINKSRLLREAQALAQLSHPNVVTVFDVGTHKDSIFMAMEFVEGQTFKELLKDKKPSRQEILDILLAAGRGLAAAHRVGIIHRDFKPANIIVGTDGRVRVLDFGLARATLAEDKHPLDRDETTGTRLSERMAAIAALDSSSGSLLQSSLTLAGAILGTPNYMAPEQHLGQPVDGKSDQFAFCVVLFEALFGQRPFQGRSLKEMVGNVIQGKLTRPEGGAGGAAVPDWLFQVVARGLKVDSSARHPSMDDLLAALQADPAIAHTKLRARRLKWAGVGLVLLFAALGALGLWYGSTRGVRRCTGGDKRLVTVWNNAARETVRSRFAATGRSYASDTFLRVEKILDQYGTDWVAMQTDACEATHVRGEQSEQWLDLRTLCLHRGLRELEALLAVFGAADDQVVEEAVQAALALTPVSRCAAGDALSVRFPLPRDEASRKKIDEARAQVASAKALLETNKVQDAVSAARLAVSLALQLNYPPAQAEAELQLGKASQEAGKYEEAEEALDTAWQLAESAGDDRLKAESTIELADVVASSQARYKEGHRLLRFAEAVISRLDDNTRLLTSWHGMQAVLYLDESMYDKALESNRMALSLAEKHLGPNHPMVGVVLNNLGTVYEALGDYPRAIQQHQLALAIWQKALGPAHPRVASSLNNLGNVYESLGDYEKAADYYTRAMAILRPAYGPEHPLVGGLYNNLGFEYARLGRYREATDSHTQALAILEKALGPDHPNVGSGHFGLGLVFVREGRLDEALARFARARAIWEKSLEPGNEAFGTILNEEGIVWRKKGDFARSVEATRKALAIFEKILGPDNGRLCAALLSLAESLLDQKKPREAAAELRRVDAICARKACTPDTLPELNFLWAQTLLDSACAVGPGTQTAWKNASPKDCREKAIALARQAEEGYAAKKYRTRDALEATEWIKRHSQ